MARPSAARVGLAAACVLHSSAFARAAPQPPAGLRAASAAEPFSAPIDLSAVIPTLLVRVNGRGPLRVGLDTGAEGGLYLFGGAAERLGLTVSGRVEATDPSGRNPRRLNTYGLVPLDLGGRIFAAETAGAPTPAPGRLHDLDGVVGLAAFGPAVVVIDFANRRLTIEAPGLPPPDGQTVFAYEGALPSLPLEIEAHRLDAYLDTGDVRAAIILPALVADQLAGRAAARPSGLAHTISEDAPMYTLALARPPRVGTVVLASSEAQFPSVAAIGILGAAALRGLVVRIDTLNRRVQLSAPPAATALRLSDPLQPPTLAR